ncbi:MAG: NAD-dependent epimerase/dehydratase family protein [Acidobacteriota bacterium]
MILLRPGAEDPGHTIAVFGVGLVGSALVHRLRLLANRDAVPLALAWADPGERDRQLEEIRARIAKSLVSRGGSRLTLVWSAGRAGFAAGADETAAELANFRAVLALGTRLAEELPDAATRIVHFSSAGGLFEGQRQVNSESVPRPRRPYGELKEAQERLLVSSRIPAVIVRLSSVYGRARPGQRAGLVSTLLSNGIRREVSSIYGSLDTLRDFVWADDVAAFVSRLILGGLEPPPSRPILLASGRPFSIFEIQKIIEDLLGYKIYISHAPGAPNREDITFSRAALPPGWVSSDLRANAGIVYREAMRTGYGSPRSGLR